MSTVEKLGSLAVGTLVLVLNVAGITRCFMGGVKPVTAQSRFVGRARTLRTVPMREDLAAQRREEPKSRDPHRIAMEEISDGEILVIGARGNQRAAVLGDLLAQRIKTAGGRGVVTDGCVRDVSAVSEVGLPVFAAGVHGGLFSTEHLAIDIDVPIACADVLVCPGDFLVGDKEGVVVIPAKLADDIAVKSVEQEHLDNFLREKIAAGVLLADAYPPSPELREEYERARKRAPRE